MSKTVGNRSLGQSLKRFESKAQEPAAPQLCRALGLFINESPFKKIHRTLEDIAERYLDINATVTKQANAMSLVKYELISRHAHLFDGKNNEAALFFALRTIEQRHRRERHTLLSRVACSSKKFRKHRDAVDLMRNDSALKSLDRDSGESQSESSGSEYLDNEKLDEEEEKEKSIQPHPVAGRLPLLRRRDRDAKDKRPSPMNSTNRRSLKQPKRQKEKFRFLEVERFLRACNPPMDHHLQRFIDFGCDNEEFLRGISSWAEGKRVAILKKILTRPKGESGVTEMEVAVIDNNLEAYFGDDR